LRCILGWHGPDHTKNLYGTGPYSIAPGPGIRLCPFCQTLWVSTNGLNNWHKRAPHAREIDWLKDGE